MSWRFFLRWRVVLAHIATDHSRYMSKSATRQARTLDIGFTMAPRPRTDNNRNRRPPDQR